MKANPIVLYYAWITALTDVYDNLIISGMVKKGYIIGPAATDNQVVAQIKNSSAAVISLRVESCEKKTSKDIHDDLMIILNENKMYFHSIIIANGAQDSCWTSSNIVFTEPKAPPPKPPASDSGNKDLN